MKREIQVSGKFLIDKQFIYWAVAKLNDEMVYVRQFDNKMICRIRKNENNIIEGDSR